MAELQQIKQGTSGEALITDHATHAFDNHAYVDEKINGIQHIERGVPKDFEDEMVGTAQVGCYERTILQIQSSVAYCFKQHDRYMKSMFLVLLVLLYFAYFSYSMYYRFGYEGSYRLMIVTVIVVFVIVWNLVPGKSSWFKTWCSCFARGFCAKQRVRWLLSLILKFAVTAALLTYIVIDIAIDSPRNLISVAGLLFFILIFYITSTNPSKVNWQPVFWGIAFQYIFALIILRTTWGYDAFQWVGDRVTEFIMYAQAGADFVFGGLPQQKIFAFYVMPVVVFFCSVIAILYHFGIMQAIIRTIGRLLAFGLGTTPAESLNVAGNMFIGQSEALALINPFLKDMTKSELHAALTGGFASVSGSTLGAYISLGVPANHLLSATVMSAPAALAMSKLSCPETEVSKATSDDFYKIGTDKVHNVIEAAYQGASQSIKLVANICINVMAFLAILKFLNNTLIWFGDRAGVEGLTFEFICSYIMYPVAFLMGVDAENCRKVAELIGIKTFLNEFIAYTTLGELVDNRIKFEQYTSLYNTTDGWSDVDGDIYLKHWNQTLIGGIMTKRSEAVATYALCGYSNIGSIGINLGALLAFAPSRRVDAPRLVIRAMICGSAACFLTGAVAGLLYKDL